MNSHNAYLIHNLQTTLGLERLR